MDHQGSPSLSFYFLKTGNLGLGDSQTEFYTVLWSEAMLSVFLLVEIKVERWQWRVRENMWQGTPFVTLVGILLDSMGWRGKP